MNNIYTMARCAECGRDAQGRLGEGDRLHFTCRSGHEWVEDREVIIEKSQDLHNRAYAEAQGWKPSPVNPVNPV